MQLLGIDTGGTFTDFVYFDGNEIKTHKVLSSSDAPEHAILQGIRELGIALSADLHVIHGSTVATNAVLEGKGAKTVYISNRGFRDVLTIGRQARKELYNLSPVPQPPPVPVDYCLETGGRITAQGEVLESLSNEDIVQLLKEIKDINPEAVAINLLFSYLDSRYEQQIAAAMPENIFVSCSSRVLPVYREYERGITTWLNAYVGPLMQGYLHRLQSKLDKTRLSIMRSSGNTCDAEQAGQEAVHLLLSGPAGGLTAAQYLSRQLGRKKILTFDMGGTSTDVALVDAQLELTGHGHIANYPVAVPMVNIHTIGAGGGSIAYVDEGGLLQVGPESSGASPGPACYGQGGQQATVTDANLILGRIPKEIKFGESLSINFGLSEAVISQLANKLRLDSIQEAAQGIVRIANEHMAQALRVISVERGIDPREFTLMAFGGAGGLHVCELAEQLGMTQAVVPNRAGVLSALGMLVAKPGRQLARTLGCLLEEVSNDSIENVIQQLAQQGKDALLKEGHTTTGMVINASLDLCYRGQAHTLEVIWGDKTLCETAFHQLHQERYGHCLDSPVELVNVRVGITLNRDISLPTGINRADLQERHNGENYVWRKEIQPGQRLTGEKIICDTESTVWIAPDWVAELDQNGHLILQKIN